jgi:hypothetical protein
MCSPNTLQARDCFSIDLSKRRVVLVEEVSTVLQPVRSWQRCQLAGGEGTAPLLRVHTCGSRDNDDEYRELASAGHDRGTGGLPANATIAVTRIAECVRMKPPARLRRRPRRAGAGESATRGYRTSIRNAEGATARRKAVWTLVQSLNVVLSRLMSAPYRTLVFLDGTQNRITTHHHIDVND